jgi:hypothetical protein
MADVPANGSPAYYASLPPVNHTRRNALNRRLEDYGGIRLMGKAPKFTNNAPVVTGLTPVERRLKTAELEKLKSHTLPLFKIYKELQAMRDKLSDEAKKAEIATQMEPIKAKLIEYRKRMVAIEGELAKAGGTRRKNRKVRKTRKNRKNLRRRT